MLLVQKFHSVHEIDPEFISSLETLLQEEFPSFEVLIHNHDKSPATDVFTYFLFFCETQNAPVGFSQLCLRQIPSKNYLSLGQKMKFWDKEHLHWKQLTWQVGDGGSGLCVFDPKFARIGKEKIQELIQEYETRGDIKALNFCYLKGMQDMRWIQEHSPQSSKERFIIEPLQRSFKSYPDYLSSLDKAVQAQIKEAWKVLHRGAAIELGDYLCPSETPKTLPIPEEQLNLWKAWGAQVLTFEKGMKILGCLLVLKGKNGNIFFEPFPFEPDSNALVTDVLYIQYALIKFFEMPEARKCHVMKFHSHLIFDNKMDLEFFTDQGFKFRTLHQCFYSRLEGLGHPL